MQHPPKPTTRKELNGISFPEIDVLQCEDEKKMRSAKIHEATRLGNLESKKVTILLHDGEHKKSVNTTIWVQTKTHIILKEKISVPVCRIVDILFET